MKYLLLAEKPSVMRDIKEVYQKYKNDYPFELDFGAFHGHLMELAQPADYDPSLKKWNLADLPIIPNVFRYKESDPASCKNLMAMIRSGGYDALINACDAGREGEHIFFSFYEAHGLKIPVLRFWASDTTEETIKKTLHHLVPAAHYDGLRQAAKYRAQLDWLAGINFSRSVSLQTKKKANIGRVVSPTLKIIVDREREIQHFVPKDFFEVQAVFDTATGEYAGTYLKPPEMKTRFDKREDAEAVLKSLGKTGVVKEVQSKQKSTKAPTLYSLTELQKDASRQFGYNADKTEAIAQSLYEKHLTSYPRTESRFLPTGMVPELMDHLKPLNATPLKPYVAKITQARIDQVTKTKDYVDNAKITDHHAIIPTKDICKDFNALTKDEQNLYLLICKRFLAIFMDPYISQSTVIITDVNGNLFKSVGKVEVSKGYSVLYAAKTKDILLPAVKKGEQVTVKKSDLRKGQTQPPDRFNTATLLEAMQNAGNFLSSEESRKILRETAGLGTPATRKDILAKLESTGMCSLKKTVFYPTNFGIALIDAIGNRMICSPQMTADWEKRLKEVEEGTYQGNFSDDIQEYITKETKDIIDKVSVDLSAYAFEVIGKCPKCGSPVVEGKNYYLCSQYKKSCDFLIPKEKMGAKITKKDAAALLSGKQTAEKKMTTQTGKTLNDTLILDQNFKVAPGFAARKAAMITDDPSVDPSEVKDIKALGTCPACGGKIYTANKFYLCTNRTSGACTWSIAKNIRSSPISEKDVIDLLSGKTTEVHSFVWASGKKGKARLKLNGTKLEFIFQD